MLQNHKSKLITFKTICNLQISNTEKCNITALISKLIVHGVSAPHNNTKNIQTSHTLGQVNSVVTVSYTHLDVYKRQVLDKGALNILTLQPIF